MEAITKQFVLPVQPQVAARLPVIYPWEQTNLFALCQQLYQLAAKTGYKGDFDEFKELDDKDVSTHSLDWLNEDYDGYYEKYTFSFNK